MKSKIAITSGIIFVLGVAQTYLIAKFMPAETAAQFFYLQSFILFAVSVGSSTIMIKNFAKVVVDEKHFNLFFPIYQVLMTLTLIGGASVYLLFVSDIERVAIFLILLSTLLNANTSVTSFLRLYDQAFIRTQWLRVGMLCLKLVLIMFLTLSEITLVKLLSIFLLADSLTLVALLFLLQNQRSAFSYLYNRKGAERGALVWGSLNATLRNLPRLMVFFIAEQFYAAQALIDLRLFLLARENLASMMSIVNLVVYREIFERSKRLIFGIMFAVSMVFQLSFVAAMNLAGLNLPITVEVVLFYASASIIYGVVQQHWGIVKHNREWVQFAISTMATAAMVATVAISVSLSVTLDILTYLTVFNLVWGVMIAFGASRSCEHPDDNVTHTMAQDIEVGVVEKKRV